MDSLKGWETLLKSVEEQRKNNPKKIKQEETTKQKEPETEPFWRPKKTIRTTASGVRLGGHKWK